MIIENTQPRMLTLPSCVGGEIDELVGKVLVPGENDVTAETWKAAKGKKAVKSWIAMGFLVEKGEGKAKPLVPSEDVEELKELKAKAKGLDAKALKDLLKQTKSKDGKSYLRALIDKEIAK